MQLRLSIACALVAGITVLGWADRAHGQAGAVQQELLEGGDTPAPYVGSNLIYRNAVSARSFVRDSNLTHNPYYEMSLTAFPRWSFEGPWVIDAQWSLSREITNSDWTARQGEWMSSDLMIRPQALNFVRIPGIDVGVTADLAITLPTSKASRAATRRFALGPGLRLVRSFDVLSGWGVLYGFRATYFNHKYTTMQFEGPSIEGCEVDCDRFRNSGARNPRARLAHTLATWLTFVPRWTASVAFQSAMDPLEDEVALEAVTFTPQQPTDLRYRFFYDVSIRWQALDPFAVTAGVQTVSAQRRNDANGFYTPFFNQFSVVYVDLTLDIGTWIAQATR